MSKDPQAANLEPCPWQKKTSLNDLQFSFVGVQPEVTEVRERC